MVDLPGPAAIELEPIRSLICFDMVKNACSTLVAFLADVSRKGMPSSSANAYMS
jgi:hypothetical protein